MYSRDIELTDGSILDIKVNFLTIKLFSDLRIARLQESLTSKEKRLERLKKDGCKKKFILLELEDEIESLSLEIGGKLIYIILRSNGKKVTEEDAMTLVPFDLDEIKLLFEEFTNKMENEKKKRQAKL